MFLPWVKEGQGQDRLAEEKEKVFRPPVETKTVRLFCSSKEEVRKSYYS